MKNELLERGNENKNLLLSVLERSKQVTAKVGLNSDALTNVMLCIMG